MIHGPLCHYWLMWTEENLSFDGALWAIPVKVFADQTVWSCSSTAPTPRAS